MVAGCRREPVYFQRLLLIAVCVMLPFKFSAAQQFAAPPQNVEPFASNPEPLPAINSDNYLYELSDDELLDLYVATYQATTQDSVLDTASLVEASRCYLQLGFTYGYDRDPDLALRNQQWTAPDFLLRYRLTERLEVRAAWAGVTFDELLDEQSNLTDYELRYSNPSLGLRWGMWKQRGLLPRTSLTFSSPFDLDSATNLLDRTDPLASVGYSWLVGERWLITGSSGAVWTRENTERYIDFQQSLTIVYFVTTRLDVNIAWSGIFPEGARLDGLNHSLGPGLAYSLTDGMQLGVSTAFGLDEGSTDFLVQSYLALQF